MKKKFGIFIAFLLTIIGTILIYNHFENKKSNNYSTLNFNDEYALVDKDNVFVSSNIDEILNILENGTGIIFMAYPECPWCQYYAKYLNEVAKENNIKEIYYLNIRYDRDINSSKYNKVINLLENYLYYNDDGKTEVFTPDLTFVKNGKIIAHDNETAILKGIHEMNAYWNQEKQEEFKLRISDYIKQYDIECSICETEEN